MKIIVFFTLIISILSCNPNLQYSSLNYAEHTKKKVYFLDGTKNCLECNITVIGETFQYFSDTVDNNLLSYHKGLEDVMLARDFDENYKTIYDAICASPEEQKVMLVGYSRGAITAQILSHSVKGCRGNISKMILLDPVETSINLKGNSINGVRSPKYIGNRQVPPEVETLLIQKSPMRFNPESGLYAHAYGTTVIEGGDNLRTWNVHNTTHGDMGRRGDIKDTIIQEINSFLDQ